jgi:hypothetical protein
MINREQTEQQIRDVMRNETRAIPLSNKLFSPEGLFNLLAKTEDERRLLAASPLFTAAQQRLLELQRAEAAEFARVVRQVESPLANENYLLKLEQTEGK